MGSFTKQVGDIGTSAAIYNFQKYGIPVAIPFDDNMPYDLIIYVNNCFYKVQVKTTLSEKNDKSMIFQTNISNPFKKINRPYEKNEVDFFFLYCIENEWCGLINFELYNKRKITIVRLEKPKNGNMEGVILADNVEFSKQIYNFFTKEKIMPTEKDKNKYVNKIKCPICNKNLMESKSSMCIVCYNKNRKILIPIRNNNNKTKSNLEKKELTRKELKEWIRKEPFTQVAKKCGVSDNAVRKWCKKYNIPFRKRDIIQYTDKEWELI